MEDLTPTQQAIAENDAREGAKALFDPKIHGVGTVAPVAPSSVSELFKLHLALEAKFEGLEGDAATYLSGMLNSFEARLRNLEAKIFPQAPADPSKTPAPTDVATQAQAQDIQAKPTSAFTKKKDSVQ